MADALKFVQCPDCGYEGPPGTGANGRFICMQCESTRVGEIPPPRSEPAPPREWWQPVLGVLVYGGIFIGIPALFLLLLVRGFLSEESTVEFAAQPPPVAKPAPEATPPPSRLLDDGRIIEVSQCIGILNGHSLVVADRQRPGGQEVRLRSVTTPDIDTRLGIEAATFVRDIAMNRSVRLTMYRPRIGAGQGQLLANVQVLTEGGAVLVDLEEILVRRGFAWVSALPHSTERLNELRILEEEARQAKVGIWSDSPLMLAPTAVTLPGRR